MAKLTKNNYKKYTRRNLLPNTDGSRPTGAEADRIFQKSTKILDQFHRDYDSLQTVRDNYERCDRYLSGDQLSDTIPNPNGCGHITEEEYIRSQGMVPMAVNIIAEPVNNIVSRYRRKHMEPLVVSRDRDEQKLGEMMTIAMEYVYETHNLPEMNTRAYEEFLSSGIAAFRVGYDRDDERGVSDVKVMQCELNRMAWDSNTSGLYFENITRIGYLHDMPLIDVQTQFAKSPREREQIAIIYHNCNTTYGTAQQLSKEKSERGIDFFHALEPEHCRVIEIWSLEMIEGEEDGYLFHDIKKGIEILTDSKDDPDIIAENNRRMLEMVEAGGAAEEASLIEYVGYRCKKKWVVRYLTPDGYVLKEEITPYAHGSHPFVVGAYPLRRGKVHSLVERLINVQRIYNSTLTSNRYIRMCQAKGSGAANLDVLERSNVTEQQFAAAFTDPAAVLGLRWNEGEEIFKPFVNNSHNMVDEKTPQDCLTLMDKISGNNGALRGETPGSGTPASLYAQQSENSDTNIADISGWFNGLIAKRDYKIMMVIQQYYKGVRYINIAGKNYSEESKWYDAEKVRNSRFDLSLIESEAQGVFRAQNEQTLQFLLQNGLISLKTYLSVSSSYFADRMLEIIKAEEEENAEAMAQQQALAAQGGAAMPQQPLTPQDQQQALIQQAHNRAAAMQENAV